MNATASTTRPTNAREKLLDAALVVIRSKGYSAATVEDLCHAAGVTKGAFFHHFASKDELGVAAAQHWSDVTGKLFAKADYHQHINPLDRIFGYIDFRAAIAKGPLEAFTCFAGTTVQEVFATSDSMRVACAASIEGHADKLAEDFRLAIGLHPPRLLVTAESVAIYTQTVLQGGFVLSKARGDRAPLLEALAHLKNYLTLLFDEETLQ